MAHSYSFQFSRVTAAAHFFTSFKFFDAFSSITRRLVHNKDKLQRVSFACCT